LLNPQGKEIVHVAAGNEHSVVLTDSGDVYTAGYNDNGQCGQGSTGRVSQLTLIDKLREFGPLMQVHAYNGCEHTLAVTEDGKLVSFGYNYRGQLGHGNTTSESVPKIVRTLEHKRVCLVSCSYYHSVVACDSGELYTFGRNDFGQLGHGDTNDKKIPIRVEALDGEVMASVACGQYHTIVSTTRGQVFTFGKNDYGQLGLESGENHRRPTLVRGTLEAEHCTLLRCGYYHTIVLCAGGRVFAFGRNDYGQLGLGHTTQRVFGPQLISELENKGITKVAAGCYHTVAVTETGAMYVFGRNNHGQLGTGDTTEKHTPTLVDTFVGKRISMVAAGFYHSIILTGGVDEQSDQKQESHNVAPFSAFSVLGQAHYGLPSSEGAGGDDDDALLLLRGRVLPGGQGGPVPDGHSSDLRVEDEDDARGSGGGAPGTGMPMLSERRSATPHDDQVANADVGDDHDAALGEAMATGLTRFGDAVSVHPTDAAIVIMAHLDRLSAPHIPSEDQYIALDPAVGVPPSTFGHFDKMDLANSAAANAAGGGVDGKGLMYVSFPSFFTSFLPSFALFFWFLPSFLLLSSFLCFFSFLPSFLPLLFFCVPSFLPSFPNIFPSFLPSFLPSFKVPGIVRQDGGRVRSFLPFFLDILPSFLPSFLDILPSFLDILPSFLPSLIFFLDILPSFLSFLDILPLHLFLIFFLPPFQSLISFLDSLPSLFPSFILSFLDILP
jgi:RCC1 and BTB domain-containing protein